MRGATAGAVALLLGWSVAARAATDAGLPAERTDATGGEGAATVGRGPDVGAPPDLRPPPEWAPKLSARVQPAMAQIGDAVQVTLKVRHRKGVSVNLPLSLELGPFSELSREESTREIGGRGAVPDLERTFELKVAAYELGRLTLPPVEVTAVGPGGELITLRTEALPIEIRSVLRNEPNPKPKDFDPPVPVMQRTLWLLYALIAVGAALLGAIVALLVSRHLRRRRERLRPPPPPVPPHVVALGRLASLELEAYVAEERYKELYLLLSEILRQYVGGRWGFDALEMTTTEIASSLEERHVAAEVRQRFVLYFNDCDLVKFAKYKPDPDLARKARDEAERLVRETAERQVLPPPPPEATGGAAPAARQEGPGGR